MHERIYLESSAKRIGLSENRSLVCKPVNIVVAKPRVAQARKEISRGKETATRAKGGRVAEAEAEAGGEVFFRLAVVGVVALTRAFLPP